MELRPYQKDLVNAINSAWSSGAQNVLAVLPTGGGKTVVFSHVVKAFGGPTVVLAHRQELVSQMSVALAREGVRHRVIGPPSLSRLCIRAQLEAIGSSWIDPYSQVGVASVQSVSAKSLDRAWADRVGLWVQDEGHHLLAKNIFGKAVGHFPRARGLSVTATPGRADGNGLGRHADGLIDRMVEGPSPAQLIAQGHLSRYKIFAPPSNLHRDEIPVTAGGDFSPVKLREATRKSTVTGDVVKHYVERANGKLGLTFADSIESASTILANFRAAGVRAEILTGKTPDAVRASVLRQFAARQILQIVSVALIDEGFDCPGVEVVSDAAATESFPKFAQRFGRGLRVLKGKDFLMYFDHVGNVHRHGLPDAPRVWSLNHRERRSAGAPVDVIPTRTCLRTDPEPCMNVYERFHLCCPVCKFVPVPASRSGPEYVDGDLTELSPDVLARMRGEIIRIDGAPQVPPGLPPLAAMALQNRWVERQQAQKRLRDGIALWAGWQQWLGRDDRETTKVFYLRYGVDIASACALGTPDADALLGKIRTDLESNSVVDSTVNSA